ncbi:MAG: hypothetical protein JWP76_5975 [Dactylosporangium sp.]|nr:hypothetical protein [Dactylosporangium sp.]
MEHNPVEIWERSTSVIRTAMNALKLDAADLVSGAARGRLHQVEEGRVAHP